MKLIAAGTLDRRVTILRRAEPVHDGYQKVPGEWLPLGFRLASVKPKMGAEPIEAEGREARQVMSFWLRFDALTRTITAADALEMRGARYEIVAPPIEVRRGAGIEVLAVAGGVPQ